MFSGHTNPWIFLFWYWWKAGELQAIKKNLCHQKPKQKIPWLCMTTEQTHFEYIKRSSTLWTFGPLTRFSYISIISLSMQMSFGRIIFNLNPLNGHYLKPPFFPNTKAKDEKTPFQRAPKILSQEQFMETFSWGTWGCTDVFKNARTCDENECFTKMLSENDF